MASPLAIGDRIVLNDTGLYVLYGDRWRSMSHMKTKEMTVTEVEFISYTSPEETYIVRVDNPDVDQCLVFDACFTKLP